MMKKKIKRLLLLLPLAGAALIVYLWGLSRSTRYNLLLVSIDSLRADHLSCYGYPRKTSPHIDALAEEGILFQNTVSSTSWTLPAHMSLFTAEDISVHGVAHDGHSLSKSIPTLPEVLKKEGYQTAAFCSSPYMNPAFGFARGFDVYHNLDLDRVGFTDTVTPPQEQRDGVHADITGPRIEKLAVDWLEKNYRRPFFLFLHMWDVHYDYIPPPPYDKKFDLDYRGTITGKDYMHDDRINAGMDRRDLEHIIALYDGEIAYTDHYLGLIIQRLKELGVYDRTLIVVTADHGDEFFEHGNKGHRISLFDEVIKVPLILKLPGQPVRAKKIEAQARLTDIAPTILSIFGLKKPYSFQGVSLLLPESARPRYAFSELAPVLQSLRTNRYKLLYNREQNKSIVMDLNKNPGEETTVLVRDHSIRKRMKKARAYRERLDRALAGKLRGGKEGAAVRLSRKEQERLRSLGYTK